MSSRAVADLVRSELESFDRDTLPLRPGVSVLTFALAAAISTFLVLEASRSGFDVHDSVRIPVLPATAFILDRAVAGPAASDFAPLRVTDAGLAAGLLLHPGPGLVPAVVLVAAARSFPPPGPLTAYGADISRQGGRAVLAVIVCTVLGGGPLAVTVAMAASWALGAFLVVTTVELPPDWWTPHALQAVYYFALTTSLGLLAAHLWQADPWWLVPLILCSAPALRASMRRGSGRRDRRLRQSFLADLAQAQDESAYTAACWVLARLRSYFGPTADADITILEGSDRRRVHSTATEVREVPHMDVPSTVGVATTHQPVAAAHTFHATLGDVARPVAVVDVRWTTLPLWSAWRARQSAQSLVRDATVWLTAALTQAERAGEGATRPREPLDVLRAMRRRVSEHTGAGPDPAEVAALIEDLSRGARALSDSFARDEGPDNEKGPAPWVRLGTRDELGG